MKYLQLVAAADHNLHARFDIAGFFADHQVLITFHMFLCEFNCTLGHKLMF